MLRPVELPEGVAGQLFLSGMPGRYGPWEDERDLIAGFDVAHVFCLVEQSELRLNAPGYARALQDGSLPWEQHHFPIPDYGIPGDRVAFIALAREAAGYLHEGKRVLIHCGAGIGRTGMLATLLLMALGVERIPALNTVKNADSTPEQKDQRDLLRWAEDQLP